MTRQAVFQPYKRGSITLANHSVMAPLARNRAGTGLVPHELTAIYYAQGYTDCPSLTEVSE
ncbi:N-ethylmaleimide reductase [Serratia marcescens]|uniref:hypothetical protein n=1 Tax=Serratia TaxID=613 RepID=UPI00217811F1|nr:N-ethylmaleimide reductase [Serratia marcescens]